jgi:hypothetical protein
VQRFDRLCGHRSYLRRARFGWPHFAQEIEVPRIDNRIEEYRRPFRRGRDLGQELAPFSNELGIDEAEAGDVASWPRQARDKTKPDRIDDECANDRDGGGCMFERGDDAGSSGPVIILVHSSVFRRSSTFGS